MHLLGRQWVVIALVGGVLAALLAVALWPRPEPVTLAAVELGPMHVTVQDEGKARVRELYTVAAPIAGELDRIDLEPGDPVTAGETVVARIRPTDAPFLDPRSEAEARAGVEAARAAVALAEAELESARATRDYARQDFQRMRVLAERGSISRSRLDQAEAALRTADAQVAAAEAALALRREELARARATLIEPTPNPVGPRSGCCVSVTAPISGQVLRLERESGGPVAAGAPLLVLGDPGQLEVVVDLLSTEAVKVAPGAAATIGGWGGEAPLQGRVRRVEPYGFTEVSALGIEEQRVNVIVDFADPAAARRHLGHGYRVEPRITVWQAPEVLRLPLGALFRDAEGRWATFVARDGRARLTPVEIGRTNDEVAQVLSGLEAGDQVVLYPGDRVADGRRITARR